MDHYTFIYCFPANDNWGWLYLVHKRLIEPRLIAQSQFESLNYVQEESIRFSLFAAYGFLDDTLILRGRVGLDTTDYGLYNQGDTIGLQVLTFQVGGDERNRLNSEFDSAPFVGLDLIFRAGL